MPHRFGNDWLEIGDTPGNPAFRTTVLYASVWYNLTRNDRDAHIPTVRKNVEEFRFPCFTGVPKVRSIPTSASVSTEFSFSSFDFLHAAAIMTAELALSVQSSTETTAKKIRWRGQGQQGWGQERRKRYIAPRRIPRGKQNITSGNLVFADEPGKHKDIGRPVQVIVSNESNEFVFAEALVYIAHIE